MKELDTNLAVLAYADVAMNRVRKVLESETPSFRDILRYGAAVYACYDFLGDKESLLKLEEVLLFRGIHSRVMPIFESSKHDYMRLILKSIQEQQSKLDRIVSDSASAS